MPSLDILELIHEHAERLDADTPPVGVDELRRIGHIQQPSRPSRRRGWLPALAAAVALAVLVGGIAFLLESPEDSTILDDVIAPTAPTTSSHTTSTAPSQPTTAPPTPRPAVLGSVSELLGVPGSWSELPEEVDGHLAADAELGVVAAGLNEIWFSSDGGTWTLTRLNEGAHVRHVTAGGPGFVAVGRAAGYSVPAIWVSSDGSVWERLPADSLPPEAVPSANCCGLEQVIAGPEGLLAAGVDARGIALWMSSDGLAWRRVTTPPGMHSDFQLLAPVGDGWISLQSTDTRDGTRDIYASSDGIEWIQVSEISDKREFSGVLRTFELGGLIYATVDTDGTPAIYHSADEGRTWDTTALAPLPEGTPEFGHFVDLEMTDYGLIAVAKAGDPLQRTYLFHSQSGFTWSVIEHDTIFDLVAYDRQLFTTEAVWQPPRTTTDRMTEVRDGPRIPVGESCKDQSGDVIGWVGPQHSQAAADLVEVSVTMTEEDIVVTFATDRPLIAEDGTGLAPGQFTVWLVTSEGRILATLESNGSEPQRTVGILDDERAHSHPDWFGGVTTTIEENTLHETWSRTKLENQLGGAAGIDGLPDDLEWFATTGAGMHGPDALNPLSDGWFDRCPD